VPANGELWFEVDGGDWRRAPGNSISLSGLALGAHSLRVQVVSGAGIPGAVTTINWTVTGTAPPPPPPSAGPGYLLLAESGQVTGFGSGQALAANSGSHNGALVDIVYTPNRQGYWTLDEQGGVVAHGTAGTPAAVEGNVARSGWRSGERAVAMSVTPSGNGYWVFTSAGRVLRFGDAGAIGDLLDVALQKPVVDAAVAAGGAGVYLVAEDGGVFALNAPFYGSVPAVVTGPLNKPVRSILPQAGGYLMVAEDGGVFAFGTTRFQGALPGLGVIPNRPIASVVASGSGYLLVGEDGGVFAFGTPFSGSLGATGSASRIVSIAAV
jgi:hypothetical protein